jgi:DNA-directed RNA polymerase specialized sigma24 family protein
VTGEMSVTHDLDDAKLLNLVRVGDAAAFAVLCQRHEQAAFRLARDLVVSPAEADVVVAETFARVLDLTQSGGGPTDAFRPYLLTALRRVCSDRRQAQRSQLPIHERQVPESGEPFVDPSVASPDRPPIVRAFMSLPERWSAVLWHTEIERANPAELTALFGLTRNGVAALQLRAKDGLRQTYLQLHIASIIRQECKPAAERLSAFVRGAVSGRDADVVTEHLSECDECSAVCAELTDVSGALRNVVAPVFLGTAAASYLAGNDRGTATIEAADGPWSEVAPGGADTLDTSGIAGLSGIAGASGMAGASGDAELPGAAAASRDTAGGKAGLLAAPRRLRHASRPAVWLAGGVTAVIAIFAVAFAVTLTGNHTPSPPAHHQAGAGPASSPVAARTSGQPRPGASKKTPAVALSPATTRAMSASASVPASSSPTPPVARGPAASPSAQPSVQLAAGINVYGQYNGSNSALVVFQVTETGSATTEALTISITLPPGSSLAGSGPGNRGPGGGDGDWTCQADATGATCQHSPIGGGSRAFGSIQIGLSGSASCGQPVGMTATSGSDSASAQSPDDIQC